MWAAASRDIFKAAGISPIWLSSKETTTACRDRQQQQQQEEKLHQKKKKENLKETVESTNSLLSCKSSLGLRLELASSPHRPPFRPFMSWCFPGAMRSSGRGSISISTSTSTSSGGYNEGDNQQQNLQEQQQTAGEESAEEKRRRRIRESSLYFHVTPDKEPLIYSSSYNIGFMGLEKLHPFDSAKWGRIREFLVNEGIAEASKIIEPSEATSEDLLVVHTEEYLKSLTRSFNVATIIEVPPVALLPNAVVKRQVLKPFRRQVGGTVLAGKLAKEKGWAINLGGGFHHCCGARGGGFCVYADITLCIQFAFERLSFSKVMIIDLDAHQGNGHERDFANDGRVYIFDMYNRDIYPMDTAAKQGINQRVEIRSGTSTEDYLERLESELRIAKDAFVPDLIIYNAGTDVLNGDPLGQLCVSAEGIQKRDEMVFRYAKESSIPIVMVTSGGYMMTSARVIADSIINLESKGLINLRPAAVQST